LRSTLTVLTFYRLTSNNLRWSFTYEMSAYITIYFFFT